MRSADITTGRALGLLLAGLLATAAVMADKPDKRDKSDGGKHGKSEQHELKGRGHFADEQRTTVRNYYGEQFRVGRCPPGLAKKSNGCAPPAHQRKWAVGVPLPPDVVYYSLPPSIVVQLGAPLSGHRYVRVAADILLIAIGTGMVVDAIQDLGGM